VMWKKLAMLPDAQPSADSRARFEAMLHAFPGVTGDALVAADRAIPSQPAAKTDSRSSLRNFFDWLRSPVGAVAWSMALLIIGVAIGARVRGVPTTTNPTIQGEEIASMHAELTSMRQMVALSMLQQQSASERLQGVSWTSRQDHLDPQVQAVLLHTLRYDTSVDVRLAALDALSRHAAAQPQVRKGVVDALQTQQSPLVQVALIDQLAEWRDPDAAQRLKNFQQTPNLNPAVRQRAEWAVSKLQ